ncbi:class I adenylate-forming enzyme family protein [Actinocorallia longicatena]|uniref:Class I adenylate-forming enzyme family protein n=1 Tax=Actinocorallia longicatena TaxID=111803 RepID=A0ABP6QTT5_9ACTN
MTGRGPLADLDTLLTAPGQPFEVVETQVRGVPTRVWKNAPATLGDALALSRIHADAVFLVHEDRRISFEEHYLASVRLAHALRDRLGVREGDRVAIAMRNLPEWSIAFWAAAVAGAVAVPLNAWWTGEELRYGLADSGASVVFCDPERAGRIGGVPGLTVVETGGPFDALLASVPATAEAPRTSVGPDDDATIFYTSGTTGRPKGALGTHRNICTNPMSLGYVRARTALRDGESREPNSGEQSSGQPGHLLSVPFFHATGCHSILIANLLAGGKLVMMRRWDPGRALELIERERVTAFGGVPSMVMQVLDHPDFAARDTSSIRNIGYGGAPAPPDLVRRITAHFPGRAASNGYGLTETSSLSTMNAGSDYAARPDSVGPPVPVVDVKVAGPDGADLPPGATGELLIRGPNIVKGYWNRPEDTAAAFRDGWFHTGDIARIDDDGFVHIVDRAKDMLIRGGENIYCVEIETVLHDHPAVADAAVIGLPHPVLGEEPAAIVQLRPGHPAGEDVLRAHVAEHLAAFKVPVRIWFSAEPLPRTAAGKILKRELRTAYSGRP